MPLFRSPLELKEPKEEKEKPHAPFIYVNARNEDGTLRRFALKHNERTRPTTEKIEQEVRDKLSSMSMLEAQKYVHNRLSLLSIEDSVLRYYLVHVIGPCSNAFLHALKSYGRSFPDQDTQEALLMIIDKKFQDAFKEEEK